MKISPVLLTLALTVASSLAADTISFEGKAGPGTGKHVVLLAGDEEYRGEEGLPQLARILSERHGFKTTVVFSINKETGEIDPNTKDHQPGIDALDSADCAIMLLRFRAWPDAQMKHFADYIAAGKPMIGLRTSTHAFSAIKGQYAKFNTFGKVVLGEGWVNHWGKHKSEATRGAIEPGAEKNPLLRGVAGIFGDTDVYEAYPPADAKILVRGLVLKGMSIDDAPADYKKARATDKQEQGINDPAMPVVWTREVPNDAGKTNQTFCTTMGSATDLQNEGMRRQIVNAVYSFTGVEMPASADVTLVGEFKPTFYSFGGFKKGMKPADLVK